MELLTEPRPVDDLAAIKPLEEPQLYKVKFFFGRVEIQSRQIMRDDVLVGQGRSRTFDGDGNTEGWSEWEDSGCYIRFDEPKPPWRHFW